MFELSKEQIEYRVQLIASGCQHEFDLVKINHGKSVTEIVYECLKCGKTEIERA